MYIKNTHLEHSAGSGCELKTEVEVVRICPLWKLSTYCALVTPVTPGNTPVQTRSSGRFKPSQHVSEHFVLRSPFLPKRVDRLFSPNKSPPVKGVNRIGGKRTKLQPVTKMVTVCVNRAVDDKFGLELGHLSTHAVSIGRVCPRLPGANDAYDRKWPISLSANTMHLASLKH